MRLEDLDRVLVIERASFPHPWSRHAFTYELSENRVARLWVARAGPEATTPDSPIVGYICLWVIADEVHVTNLAVHPEHRGQGVARQLLGTLLEMYRQQGATRAALEVRPANHQARRLYEAFGFRQVGLRKGYYFDTGEDAVLMEARLPVGDVPPPPTGRQPTGRATGNPGAG
jgi:[ribosomal protein S18]-alanine N-acetyltransferase